MIASPNSVQHEPPRVVRAFLERPTWVLFSLLLLAEAAALWLMLNKVHPLIVVAAAAVTAVLPLAVQSVPRMLALVVVVVMVTHRSVASIPTPLVYERLLLVPPILWAMFLIVREYLDTGRSALGTHGFGKVWLPLIVWTAWVTMHGLLRGNNPLTFSAEVGLYLLYGTFFLAVAGVKRPGDVTLLLAAYFAGMAVVAMEYAYAMAEGASWDLRWGRVISRQANLGATTIPFVIGLFLTRSRGAWWWLLGIPPIVFVAMLSQQRSLFLGLIAALVTAIAFALRCPTVRKREVGWLLVGAAIGVGLAYGATSSLNTVRGGPSVSAGLSDRVEETSDVASTPALVIRLVSFAYVWEHRIVDKPITGWGIGNTAAIPILRGNTFNMMRVDNSFVTLWWKSGIIGLALFVALWSVLFVKAWRLTRHPHPHVQILAIGTGGTVAALFVLALAGSIITHYRFNALWGILMGVVAVAERVYGPRSSPSREIDT